MAKQGNMNGLQRRILKSVGLKMGKGWKKRLMKLTVPDDFYDLLRSVKWKSCTPQEIGKLNLPDFKIPQGEGMKKEKSNPKKVDYFSYMKSKAWRERSKKCLTEAGFQCEACEGIEGGLAAHHYNYLNLGNETRLDLFCLCSPCHSDYHSAFPAKMLPQDQKSARPVRLYHLTLEIARYRSRPRIAI